MKKLSGRRAAWLGLLATPVLVISAVLLAGVTAGSAGPSPQLAAAPKAAAAPDLGVVSSETKQTLAEVKAYWTAERMANAKPMPVLTREVAAGDPGPQQVSGNVGMGLAMMQADGSVQTTKLASPADVQPLTETYHADIPFSRWQWFGRYLRNQATNANRVIATVGKMFFTLNSVNYVCSASSIGADAAWTAGHCVSDGSSTFSTNVLFCPSYDSTQGGVNPTAGCWGSDTLWVTSCYHTTGDGDCDMGAIDTSDTGTVQPMQVGNYTTWNGLAWGTTNTTGYFNRHWIGMGYPQGAPFNGGSLQVAASSLGYVDEWTPGGNYNSVAMGSDLTGGSSGGPWIWQFGRIGQAGGLDGLYLNGHNDWRHNAEPGEMNSPFFNCLAVAVYNSVNGTAIACP